MCWVETCEDDSRWNRRYRKMSEVDTVKTEKKQEGSGAKVRDVNIENFVLYGRGKDE